MSGSNSKHRPTVTEMQTRRKSIDAFLSYRKHIRCIKCSSAMDFATWEKARCVPELQLPEFQSYASEHMREMRRRKVSALKIDPKKLDMYSNYDD